jgi:hypothetical protein
MMAFLSSIFRHGLWIAPPSLGISILLLGHCIAGVIRTGRQARLFSVPLVERQQVEFAEAGPVVLAMEGPISSRRFAGLDFGLVGPDGADVGSRRALLRATTTGFTKATKELRVFEIAVPGRHVFRIHGLSGQAPRDGEHRMVFTRPHLARSMGYVLGIVLSGVLVILSIVLLGLRLSRASAD